MSQQPTGGRGRFQTEGAVELEWVKSRTIFLTKGKAQGGPATSTTLYDIGNRVLNSVLRNRCSSAKELRNNLVS